MRSWRVMLCAWFLGLAYVYAMKSLSGIPIVQAAVGCTNTVKLAV
jgi:hypothetical protein